MIRPTKFLNLDNCVLSISAHILKILLKEHKISYNKLYLALKEYYDDNFDYYFLPALDFLFLLGKIKYSSESDTLELTI